MNADEFTQRVQDAYQRAQELCQHLKAVSLATPTSNLRHEGELLQHEAELLVDCLQELHLAPDVLYVAEMELEQQNHKLVAAHEVVAAERQRYQDLFEFAPDGYLVTDMRGQIHEANRAAAALLNMPQQFLIGKPLAAFVPLETHTAFHSKLNQLPRSSRAEWEMRLEPYCSQNEPGPHPCFDAALTVITIRDHDGKPVSLRWSLRDITTAKHLQAERSQAEKRLHQLNSDLDRQVQERTAELQQALDFEAALKRITDKVRDSLDESQILQTAVQEVALGLGAICCNAAMYNFDQGTSTVCYEYTTSTSTYRGRVVQMAPFPELYRQLKQGQYFQFCSTTPNPQRGQVTMLACPILDNQGVLGDLWLIKPKEEVFSELEIRLVQQVTNQCAIAIRQARLYQAVQAQVEELKKLDRLKNDFLNTVSHELRTPISNMKVSIHLLQTAPTSERREHYLRILQAECHREAELINDLLDLQRLEANGYTIGLPQSLNLQDWLPQVIEPFQSRTRNHQQILEVNLPSDLPLLALDSVSLRRVLVELLNNACKYTPDNGCIVFSICHTPNPLVTSNLSSVVTFTVSNEAEIPVAELPHLFEKFYRGSNIDPWKQGGTGLGLALVKKLVEQLQGTIQVKSEAGWSTFKIQLPA